MATDIEQFERKTSGFSSAYEHLATKADIERAKWQIFSRYAYHCRPGGNRHKVFALTNPHVRRLKVEKPKCRPLRTLNTYLTSTSTGKTMLLP